MERVFLVDCSRYDPRAMERGIRTAAEALGIHFPRGQEVLIHPDCPWAHPRFAPNAFTHPALIEAAASVLTGNDLTVATNSLPGFPTRYSYRKAGYVELSQRLRARLVAIDEVSTETVQLRENSVVDKQAALPEIALRATFTVAMPKLTGSTFVSLAGAIRHHQSLLQDDAQVQGHHRLHTKMVDLLSAALPDLIVVDAVVATHKGGELSGLPVELRVLIIGTNPVAVDTICAVAYGHNSADIRYLQIAAERGIGPADLAQIEVLGDLTIDALRERARRVEHVDPNPDRYPLPPQLRILRSDVSGLGGTCGGLTEVFLILEHGGISLQNSREAVIVIGKIDHVPAGKSEKATIVFLDDTARAEYKGYSRVVRLSGRYVPLSKLLNDVPYALKVSNLRNELGGDMLIADLSSKVARFAARLTSKGRK